MGGVSALKWQIVKTIVQLNPHTGDMGGSQTWCILAPKGHAHCFLGKFWNHQAIPAVRVIVVINFGLLTAAWAAEVQYSPIK